MTWIAHAWQPGGDDGEVPQRLNQATRPPGEAILGPPTLAQGPRWAGAGRRADDARRWWGHHSGRHGQTAARPHLGLQGLQHLHLRGLREGRCEGEQRLSEAHNVSRSIGSELTSPHMYIMSI